MKTPKDKAIELYYQFYNILEHKFSEEYSPYEDDIVKECVLIGIKNTLNEMSDLCDDKDYRREVEIEVNKIGISKFELNLSTTIGKLYDLTLTTNGNNNKIINDAIDLLEQIKK